MLEGGGYKAGGGGVRYRCSRMSRCQGGSGWM